MLDEYAIRVLTLVNTAKRLDAADKYEQIQIAMVPNMDKSGINSMLKHYEFQAIEPTDLFDDSDMPTDAEVEQDNKKVRLLFGEANKKGNM